MDSKPGPSQEPQAEGASAASAQMSLLDYMSLPENKDANMVMPLTWCKHLDSVCTDSSKMKYDSKAPCLKCSSVGENWMCLVCGEVHCSRYVKEHMLAHHQESGHQMALSLADLSVWCYGCDYYVDNEKLFPAKNALHVDKFGEPLPQYMPAQSLHLEN